MELKLLIGLLVLCLTNISAFSITEPIIIGHRGASGSRPENTLASYEKAISLGADFIEADIVSTKDHVLVASHNPDITENTDVANHDEFGSRYREKNVSGEIYKGFFVDDFTVNELKSLRTRERFHFRDHSFDDLYPIPTLQEIITLVKAKEIELGREIGLYLETKHPSYYASIGLPLEQLLIDTLNKNGYNESNRSHLVYIESFESNLIQIRKLTNLSLVQLVSGTEGDLRQFDTQTPWREMTSYEGLQKISTYANAVAPHRSCIFIPGENNEPVLTSLIQDAHNIGLKVHVWTFRKEKNHFDEKKDKVVLFKTIQQEIKAHFNAGVDGIFTDHPEIGVEIKEAFLNNNLLEFFTYYCVPVLLVIIGFLIFLKLIEKQQRQQRQRLQQINNSPDSSNNSPVHPYSFTLKREKSNSF